jgi:DNA-binding HxlR family transcriptional regulator
MVQRSLFLSAGGGWSEDVSGILRVLGRRWTLQILRSLSADRALRFVELKSMMGVSSTVLSERLMELEREGLVAKVSTGYSLTTSARELKSLLSGVKGTQSSSQGH